MRADVKTNTVTNIRAMKDVRRGIYSLNFTFLPGGPGVLYSPVSSFTDVIAATNYGLVALKSLQSCRLDKNPRGNLQKFMPEPLSAC